MNWVQPEMNELKSSEYASNEVDCNFGSKEFMFLEQQL